ncbi:non-heme iron oxygenase ferredoxin subunit [Bordetella petrii]|uniref:non-heme iron oxygenase ferredoxin subunit n=1 Tax=Bordetella petrii TaxID=94624 RepID=UPI00372E5BCE
MTTALWTAALPHGELAADDVTPWVAGGREIALYAVGDAVYATDNLCTHGLARLCDGFLEGHEIECPLHQGRFDVRSGKALCAPLKEDIKTYPVKIEDGMVYVQI